MNKNTETLSNSEREELEVLRQQVTGLKKLVETLATRRSTLPPIQNKNASTQEREEEEKPLQRRKRFPREKLF